MKHRSPFSALRSSSYPDHPPSIFHHRASRAFASALFLLPLAFNLHTSAVQQAWIAKYNSGPGSTNPPVGIALDNDLNIYVAGSSTRSAPPYDFDYVVIKYNSLGVQQWVNRFGSPNVDDKIRAMAISTNGDVFVTGTSNTIKYLSSGLLAWTAPYGGSDIKVDGDEKVYVTGFRTDAYSTVKIAPTGTNLWLRLWDRSPREDVSQRVAVDNMGNVAVAGFATFNCDRITCYRQPWLVQYDASGSILWTILLFEGYYYPFSQFRGAICDVEGNLYLGANLWDSLPWAWANRQITAGGNYGGGKN